MSRFIINPPPFNSEDDDDDDTLQRQINWNLRRGYSDKVLTPQEAEIIAKSLKRAAELGEEIGKSEKLTNTPDIGNALEQAESLLQEHEDAFSWVDRMERVRAMAYENPAQLGITDYSRAIAAERDLRNIKWICVFPTQQGSPIDSLYESHAVQQVNAYVVEIVLVFHMKRNGAARWLQIDFGKNHDAAVDFATEASKLL